MASKKLDPKAKAKKQKMLAGGLAVALLAVLAFSIPKTMKMMNQGNVTPTTTSAAPTTTTTSAGAVPLAPPSLDGTAPTPAAPASDGSLSDPGSAATTASYSQLVSFDRFDSKDPFTQQVSANGTDATSSSSSSSAAPVGLPDIPATAGSSGSGSVAGGSGTSGTAAKPPPAPMPTAAVVTVNGGPYQTVGPNVDFPLTPLDPLFHVVALTRTSVKVTIIGGSYASGAPAAVIKKGKPLVLVNTADGTRYELKLLWLGTGAPPPALATPPTGGGAAPTPASTPAVTPATTPATGG